MRHAPRLSRLSLAVRLTSRQPKAGRRAQTCAYPASLNQFRQLAGFPAVRNHHLHSRGHRFSRRSQFARHPTGRMHTFLGSNMIHHLSQRSDLRNQLAGLI